MGDCPTLQVQHYCAQIADCCILVQNEFDEFDWKFMQELRMNGVHFAAVACANLVCFQRGGFKW